MQCITTLPRIGEVRIMIRIGCEDGSALTTDQRVRGPSSWHDQTFTQSEESRKLSVIPGVGITRCGHIERKDKGTAR